MRMISKQEQHWQLWTRLLLAMQPWNFHMPKSDFVKTEIFIKNLISVDSLFKPILSLMMHAIIDLREFFNLEKLKSSDN